MIVGVDVLMVNATPTLLRGQDTIFRCGAPNRASVLSVSLLSLDLPLNDAIVPEKGEITPNHLRLQFGPIDMAWLGVLATPFPQEAPALALGGTSSMKGACFWIGATNFTLLRAREREGLLEQDERYSS